MAIDAIEGTPNVFLDGVIILIPESEIAAIEKLKTLFNAEIEHGHGKEFEFLMKARAAGVSENLIRLGDAIFGHKEITLSADDMVHDALEAPEATYKAWSKLYRDAMNKS